jgi:hypothetical protein
MKLKFLFPEYIFKVDSIKMDLKEIGFKGVNWIYLAPDMDQWQTAVKMVLNCLVS